MHKVLTAIKLFFFRQMDNTYTYLHTNINNQSNICRIYILMTIIESINHDIVLKKHSYDVFRYLRRGILEFPFQNKNFYHPFIGYLN